MSISKKNKTPNSAPSMAEIARLAGVGKMTVSRALAGSPNVSEEKRARILKIAREIGYNKSNLVSTVMSHMARSRSVDYGTPLVLLFDSPPPKARSGQKVYEQLITGARRRAQQFGFPLEVMYHDPKQMKDSRLDTILAARGIQGLIINVIKPKGIELRLSWDRLTAVTLGGHLTFPEQFPQLHGDISRTMYQAFTHIKNRGYKRIGFVGQTGWNEDFKNLYRASVLLHQDSVPAEDWVDPLFDPEMNNDQMVVDWYHEARPDAVLCTYQTPVEILRKAGLEAPRDYGFFCMGVASFEGNYSGIYLDRSRLAEAAVDIVAKNVLTGNFGVPHVPSRVLLRGTVWEGGTLRGAPVEQKSACSCNSATEGR